MMKIAADAILIDLSPYNRYNRISIFLGDTHHSYYINVCYAFTHIFFIRHHNLITRIISKHGYSESRFQTLKKTIASSKKNTPMICLLFFTSDWEQ